MCFHNILGTLSSKHIKEMYNINIIFDTKHEKIVMVTLPMAPIFVNVPLIYFFYIVVYSYDFNFCLL
jgi:hypothetical protein